MPLTAAYVIGVSGVRVSQFMERLRCMEVLTQVYWSDRADSVDAVLATGFVIVKAICNKETRRGRITLYRCGGEPTPMANEYSIELMEKTIFSAAAFAQGTAWCVVDQETTKTCPYCGATYVYPQERFIDGVNVECQNCTKVFDTRMNPEESPPTRALGEPTECPYCRAQYVYRENDLDEQRTTACRNCGVRIGFPSLSDEWQEYQQIQDNTWNERKGSH